MVPSFGMLLTACFLVGAGVWCKEVIGWFPSDFRGLVKGGDPYRGMATVIIWLITTAAAFFAGRIVLRLMLNVMEVFR